MSNLLSNINGSGITTSFSATNGSPTSFNTDITTRGNFLIDINSKNLKSQSRAASTFNNPNLFKTTSTTETGDNKSSNGMNIMGGIAGGIGAISDMIPSMDKVHNSNDAMIAGIRDTASNALLQSGNPFAMAAGAAIKVIDKTGGFTDASKGLGGGIDAANAIAGLALPGFGYFAPKTDSLEVDSRIQESSSYTGLADTLNTAKGNADAKLLFGYSKANAQIADAKRKQNQTVNILEQSEKARAAATNPFISTGIQSKLSGGYDIMTAAKNGAKLYNIEEARRILTYKNGDKIKKSKKWNYKPKYEEWLLTVNPEFNNPNYDLKTAYDIFPFEQLEAWRIDPNNNHLGSIREISNPDGTFDYEFLKLGTMSDNKEIIPEIRGYYADPNWHITPRTHKLEYNNGRYYYKAIPPTVINNESTLIDAYKQGGSFNVIPDGALHKNRHHLEEIDSKFENVTHKGIPIISETEEGKITQHAEVEKEEIIFRLEVTQKLEELAKENTDKAAIEAGKLLVKEILYNTKDYTNKLI